MTDMRMDRLWLSVFFFMATTWLALASQTTADEKPVDELESSTTKLTLEQRSLVESYRSAKASRAEEVIAGLENELAKKNLDKDIRYELLQRIRKIRSGQEDVKPLIDARALNPDEVGTLFFIQLYAAPRTKAEVMQVIDENNSLILGESNAFDPEPIWLIGPTGNLVDGSNIDFSNFLVRVVEPRRYETTFGSMKTVAAVKVIDMESLERAYDDELKVKISLLQSKLEEINDQIDQIEASREARYDKALSEIYLYEKVKHTEGGAQRYSQAKSEIDEIGDVSDDDLKNYRESLGEFREKRKELVVQIGELKKKSQ